MSTENDKGTGQIRILLVDDEKDFVDTLSQRMEMRDLNVDTALSGEEALEQLRKQPPDVMVLDLRMPGMDGMDVLRRVKKEHPHVQVIMLTGQGSEKDEREARRLGAFDYLEKPVNIDTLVSRILSHVLLVVGNEERFSDRLIDYALEMAERMSFRLVAVSPAPFPESILDQDPVPARVSEFEQNARENAEIFAGAAEEKGIPFEHVIRYGQSDAVAEQVAKEYGNVEFVVSEPSDQQAADQIPCSPGKICVYTMA